MLNQLVTTSILTEGLTLKVFILAMLTAFGLGLISTLVYMYRNEYSKNFVVTLTLLPAIVGAVILMVNGNLGTGIAVMGAFSLVRFRSIPGGAREIGSIFLAMAIGLATGTGYLGVALVLTLVIGGMSLMLFASPFGELGETEKDLRIVIPEELDYMTIFDDLFAKYTKRANLVTAKTTNMGSLYELQYQISLKDRKKEKDFIDELRCRNGNLTIICGRLKKKEEL